jgi:UDP-N-acetylmuramyl pentapeptide phosphotransferase/UDP-N-acetylglucosamine-1-phosphate transferase
VTGLQLAAPALAILVSWVLSRLLASGRVPALLDHPNERSLHHVPTPRSGGLAIVAAIACGQLVVASRTDSPDWLLLLAAALPVLLVSFLDDLRGLPAALRMLVHLLAAIGYLVAVGAPQSVGIAGHVLPLPPLAATGLAALFLVWMTNLYNFMDGMDGFAGGMGVFGFGGYAILSLMAGDLVLATACATVAAACAGFLSANFPPARIFMGDTGSSVLGFCAGGVALLAEHRGLFPLWIAVLVFSPFVVDATVTLLRRTLRGEVPWQAHRTHFYQRLVRLGWGHRRTVLTEYVLMAACVISALVAWRAPSGVQLATACGWLVVYVILGLYVTALERRHGGQREGGALNP